MSDTLALEVARVYTQNIFCYFRVPSLIHHNLRYIFISEILQIFVEMMQVKPRSTLSYIKHSNGQHDRILNRMIQTV